MQGHCERAKRPKQSCAVAAGFILGFLAGIPLLAAPVSSQEKNEKNPVLSSTRLQVSGYAQVLYSWWEEGVDSFLVKRARLSLSGEIVRKIRFKLQADAVKSPILVDAQVDFEFSPYAGLRIG
ncbi:MAG: hypothetical protein FJY81_03120, partial [Candidatus Aminicenantes bacterium]|nr:hypothetical protein [Candidatus Aminicenantes bacterium]